jgi:hypothetical protein
MTYQKNDLEVIELNFNVEELLVSGVANGTLGDFTINFSSPINLNPMDEYQIGLHSLYFNNPVKDFVPFQPKNDNSWFLYCDLCEVSRVGSSVANVLHKSLNGKDIMRPETYLGTYDYVKLVNNASIIDWKKLTSKSFSSIGFQFRDSTGVFYPSGVSFLPPMIPRLFMRIIIKKVGSSSNSKALELSQLI